MITYGLTQYTLQTYRGFLGYGMTHERAMESLKRLYKHNKDTYVNPPDFSNVYGHSDYVSPARAERLQPNKG
ncbi:hypothetical protein HOS90_gp01 [Yersinia phage fPS-53]|uniref:Uncharacterized protein n=4 Tax=Helsettvirus TaxID=2732684 RepID=A0A2H1UJ67_9CAUD|nr:hypothetical protein HOS90_gp01 [Yersinia phage fPS-53]YP_009799180.1 hypothetical protein HOS91_gp01 [Yersinia phage fPS-54-ocr]SOO46587.1 hypothetical protein [Yersinia phage fPS-89]SOO56420.1 hypothetical protein [Yersinia phage fPS-85]SOO56469.1 hypothetical protein [Yersinia phage fPS-53]SOP75970.1 hypothetical protein [Yersinia phage fPS-54-ocr]